MYSGIIREKGRIARIERIPGGVRHLVRAPLAARHARRGDSVGVDGCCLTVAANRRGVLSFDLSPETLVRTVAGDYRAGTRVNIETSMHVGTEIGGHFVTGHVDTVGEVLDLKREGDFATLVVRIRNVKPGLIAEKGSVSVNGVSLTVASWRREHVANRPRQPAPESGVFTIALIPETLARTNLDDLRAGSRVNLEYDLIARYVAEALEARGL